MPKHEKKRVRTNTERTLLFLEIMASITSFLAMAAALHRLEGTVYLVELAGGWLGATAVFYVLYCKKESRANSQKYMEAWVEKVADKYGPDYAARYAEIVLNNSNQ